MIRNFVEDTRKNFARFILETFGTIVSVFAAWYLAVSSNEATPTIMTIVFGFWLCGSIILMGTAYNRGSVGFFILYAVYTIINVFGLANALGVIT